MFTLLVVRKWHHNWKEDGWQRSHGHNTSSINKTVYLEFTLSSFSGNGAVCPPLPTLGSLAGHSIPWTAPLLVDKTVLDPCCWLWSSSTDMSSTEYRNVQYRVQKCRICSVPSCPDTNLPPTHTHNLPLTFPSSSYIFVHCDINSIFALTNLINSTRI